MRINILRKLLILSLLASACAAQSISGQAPVSKLLYSPSAGDSVGYLGSISEVQPGLFYALSAWITPSFGATIFSVTSTGTFKSIHVFPSTNNTQVITLVQAANGVLYGSAGSNSGSFYISISPSGTNLKYFPLPGKPPAQWGPFNRTIAAPPRELYDLVSEGIPSVYGLARIDETGKINIVGQFSGGTPNPFANILYGPDGNIYGIGNQQYGDVSPSFIYRFTPAGVYSILLNFPSVPGSPLGYSLVAASDGNLYGTFPVGGTNNTGYVYQATLSGQYQVVANFPAQGMIQPGGTLLEAADGNIYGTTNSNHIFRYNVTTKQLSKVYLLDTSQGRCYCQLIEGMDGKLYGVAATGGNIGIGAIFSLNIGLPKPTPVISRIVPAAGPVGQKVLLWGQYLLGATSVTFNGVPAVGVLVASGQSAYVAVPPGASTGPVTIKTANGSFTTSENFTVQ